MALNMNMCGLSALREPAPGGLPGALDRVVSHKVMLFHMMRNSYISETKLVDTAAREIGARLPARWSLGDQTPGRSRPGGQPKGDSMQADAILELRDPDGQSDLHLAGSEDGPAGTPARVGRGVQAEGDRHSLGSTASERPGGVPVPMVVSSYLSPLARERLAGRPA